MPGAGRDASRKISIGIPNAAATTTNLRGMMAVDGRIKKQPRIRLFPVKT